jgi:parvulin-like peptidyl-prolyl isomerase
MITINKHEISEKEFSMACNDFCARLNIQKLNKAQFEAILNQLIDARLMIEQAKVENIKVTDAEIENILTKIKANFKSPEHFIDVLKKEGDTEQTLREKIADDLLLKSYIDAHFGKVTEEDEAQIKKYYEENKNLFRKDVQVEASHI